MSKGSDRDNHKPSFSAMDRRSAIKTSLAGAAAAGAAFQPKVLGFVQPRKNLSGDGTGIFAVTPSSGTLCSGVQIRGRGFGLDPANIHCTSYPGDLHFQTATCDDQRILTQIRFGHTQTNNALNVSLGQGAYATPSEFPTNLTPYGRFWAWRSNNSARYLAAAPFVFQPSNTLEPGELRVHGADFTNGALSLYLTLPFNDDCCRHCPAGTFIGWSFYVSDTDRTNQLAAQGQFFVEVEVNGTELLNALGAVVVSTVRSMTGVALTRSVTETSETTARLTLSRPGFNYSLGSLGVRINHFGRTMDCGPIDSQSFDTQSIASLGAAPPSSSINACDSASIAPCDSQSIDMDFPDFLFQ